ncbi:PQQ-binding-like beta-propeller repeat protein [Actinomadura sp. KC06]|uniref:outer membrane protein assembly factor BamB family protein n=1 Tax=Actinomadura sp. KC06 TaxID=2530369 RepID=UPI00140497B3|nr:PQQ-binding-like beta-propeller repeat protein [Actinomadura sp. KC06]
MTRTRALWWGGGLLAVLLLLVLGGVRACGGQDVADLPHGEKRPAPVSFGGKPLWDERKLGMSRVAGIELRGDTAVVAGDVGLDGARLAAVDARTGTPRWVLDSGHPLRGGGGAVAHHDSGYQAEHLRGADGKPLIYGDGDDWTVLVQYGVGGERRESELGVAALSGKDGAVRWKRPLIRPRGGDKSGDDREQRMRLLGADTRVILTSLESRQGLDPETVALDPATGRELWRNADGWAFRIAGDVVLGETHGAEAPPTHIWGERRKDTDVFALDVTSGKKRWDLGDTVESSHLMAAANGTAVIKVNETPPGRTYSRDRTMLIDIATGRPTKHSPKADGDGTSEPLTFYGCADDGRTLIACSGSDGRLVTIRPGRHGEPVVSAKRPFGEETMARVGIVRQDRILVMGSAVEGRPARYAIVDRAANRLGTPPPGEATALSEHVAAFRVTRAGSISSRPDGLAVHAAAVGAKPPSEPSRPGPATARPPRIDAAPLWTAGAGEAPVPPPAKDTGLESLISIDLAGDAVVYTGRDRADDDLDRLVVADAATGKVRWSVREGASLGGGAKAGFVSVPHIVDGEGLVLVRYEDGDAEGVAALSLKDGRTRWTKRVTSGNAFLTLKAADRSAFAVEVTSYDGPEDGRDETVVFATGTRHELWRKRGVSPVGAGGGLVLAARFADGENGRREPRDLIAYGTSDGKERWRLGTRYRDPELLHDGGGRTIVVGTAEGGVVLDRATGRALAGTYAPLVQCDGDGDGDVLIVCRAGSRGGSGSDPSGRAVIVQTQGGATTIRDLLETGALTRYGAAGNLFTAIRPAAEGRPERFLLLDGEGRQIVDDLPGRPMDVGGGFAVLTPSALTHGIAGAGVPNFTVHRVRG